MLKLTSVARLHEHKFYMAKRPKIAVTTRLELGTNRFYLARDYTEAIAAFGGTPLMVSLIPDGDYIASVMEGVDGLLLPGSDSDVDPLLYGQEPHPRLGPVVMEKDATDLLVLAEAEKRNLPVFAICFGMQSLNVSRGGTLIQDIGSHVDGCLKHEQGIPRDRVSHTITIEKGTRLFQLSGKAAQVRVNSHHHQAVAMVGNNLKVAAYAADGVVECIQDTRGGRYVVGVQWHPELSWKTDALSGRLLDDFVNNC